MSKTCWDLIENISVDVDIKIWHRQQNAYVLERTIYSPIRAVRMDGVKNCSDSSRLVLAVFYTNGYYALNWLGDKYWIEVNDV